MSLNNLELNVLNIDRQGPDSIKKFKGKIMLRYFLSLLIGCSIRKRIKRAFCKLMLKFLYKFGLRANSLVLMLNWST